MNNKTKSLEKLSALFFIFLVVLMPISFAIQITVEPEVSAGTTSAVVTWETDVPSDSRVEYGEQSYTKIQSNPNEVTKHTLTLPSLKSGVSYFYKVSSFTDSGDSDFRTSLLFKTKDNTPPKKILGVRNGTIKSTEAYVYWTKGAETDIDKYLLYQNGALIKTTTSDGVYLTGLDESTKYIYYVLANDTSGNVGEKSDSIAIYTPDSKPPAKITGLKSGTISNTTINFVWDKNNEDDLKEYIIYRNLAEIGRIRLNSFTDRNLTPGTKYAYAVAAADDSGNIGEKSDDLNTATISSGSGVLAISNITINENIISWITNDYATTSAFFGESSPNESIVLEEISKDHQVSLPNIEKGKKYQYYIESCRNTECVKTQPKQFLAGYPSEAPQISANIPLTINTKKITIEGTTKSLSYVELFVNGALKGVFPNTGEKGNFKFSNIPLDEKPALNNVKISVKDFLGQTNSKEYQISVDTSQLALEVSLPQVSASSSVDLKGTVSKKSTIKISVLDNAQNPPAKVEGLSLKETNSVDLSWTSVTGADKYLIYREDVGLLAISVQNHYVDTRVNGSRTYTYFVSAMDRLCREGPRSESVSVLTTKDTSNDYATSINNTCNVAASRTINDVLGEFSSTVQLKQGQNIIRVEATDSSGNKAVKEQNVLFDNTPIQILEPTDLSKFTPVYVPELSIKGKANKFAQIYIYLNNEPEPRDVVTTNMDGSFKLDIPLTNYNEDKTNKTNVEYTYNDIEAQRSTFVKIVAVDYMNKTSPAVSGQIDYAVCSYGTWWKISTDKPLPDVLIPSMLRSGVAQIGLPFKLEWNGGNINYTFGSISVGKRQLSASEKENWDEEKISSLPSRPNFDPLTGQGYVAISLRPWDPFPGDKKKTEFDREDAISKNRYSSLGFKPSLTLNQYECSIPKMGCVKIPLVATIKFREGNDTRTQKQCWDIEVAIDKRLPPGKLPRTLLSNSLGFFNASIKMMDAVLDPLKKIMPIAFYSCIGSQAVSFVWEIGSQVSMVTSAIGSMSVNPQVPTQGRDACYSIYGQGELKNDVAYQQCLEMAESEISKKTFDRYSHYVCDRIFSPAVPTFQKYVKDNTKLKGKDPIYSTADIYAVGKDGKKVSDKKAKLTTNHVCNGVEYDAASVVKLYELKTKIENGQADPTKYKLKVVGQGGVLTDTSLEEYCKEAIPYNEIFMSQTDEASFNELKSLCCLYSYLGDWSSGCLFMDVDKQSACMAAEVANMKDKIESMECSTAVNMVAGICEKNNEQEPQLVLAGRIKDTKSTECTGGISLDALEDKNLYFLISKPDDGSQNYKVQPGVVVRNWDLIEGDKKKAVKTDKTPKKFSQSFEFLEADDADLFTDSYFAKDAFKQSINGKDMDGMIKFRDAKIGGESKSLFGTAGCIDANPDRVFTDIYKRLGIPDQQYAVDPTSGLIRSVQCVSLPSLKGHLDLWRNILVIARDCVNSIALTGEGSAGACRSLVSVYLCDIIYDLISCFMNNAGGLEGSREGGGIGNVFGAVSNAGARVSSKITERYGTTNTFSAVFGERKLVHAICSFAFTGDWVFDLNAALEQTYNVPVSSQAFIAQANRRFVSFNPVAQQGGVSGLSTYNYHVALLLVAGSDVKYTVKLLCSSDYSCTDPDYASGGKCDCASVQRTNVVPVVGVPQVAGGYFGREADITGQLGLTGMLKRGEVLNIEKDVLLANQNVRFDKVILEYTYSNAKDAPKEQPKSPTKHISLIGGTPPAFCQFDEASLYYRCALNMDNEAWAKIEAVSVKSSYAVGEDVDVAVDVMQKIPKDNQELCNGRDFCEYTKFLALNILNNNGRSVFESTMPINSIERRQYILPRDILNGKNQLKITKEMVAGGSTVDNVLISKYGNLAIKVVESTDQDSDFKFAVKFGAANTYTICSVDTTITDYKPENFGCNSEEKEFKGTVTHKGITLKVDPDKKGETIKENSYFVVSYKVPAAACRGEAKFTAKVSLYDAAPNGFGSYKPSAQLAFYGDSQNPITREFTVKCPTTTSSDKGSGDFEFKLSDYSGVMSDASKSDKMVFLMPNMQKEIEVVLSDPSKYNKVTLKRYSEKDTSKEVGSVDLPVDEKDTLTFKVDTSKEGVTYYQVIVVDKLNNPVSSAYLGVTISKVTDGQI